MAGKGGAMPGSGRKPKNDEQKLIEALCPYHDNVIEKLSKAAESGAPWAVKLFLEYYYGKPKQSIKLDGELKQTDLRVFAGKSKAEIKELIQEMKKPDDSGTDQGSVE